MVKTIDLILLGGLAVGGYVLISKGSEWLKDFNPFKDWKLPEIPQFQWPEAPVWWNLTPEQKEAQKNAEPGMVIYNYYQQQGYGGGGPYTDTAGQQKSNQLGTDFYLSNTKPGYNTTTGVYTSPQGYNMSVSGENLIKVVSKYETPAANPPTNAVAQMLTTTATSLPPVVKTNFDVQASRNLVMSNAIVIPTTQAQINVSSNQAQAQAQAVLLGKASPLSAFVVSTPKNNPYVPGSANYLAQQAYNQTKK